MEKLKYKMLSVFSLDKELIDSFRLEKVANDSVNWREYFKNPDSNWISFYPFSEYHGGGQPYIIKIGLIDFEKWISENVDFEKQIRILIDNE
jgi:hypothetical protein